MVNEPLLLVQPWFSELGHPAQSTLFFARALSLHAPVTILAYVSSQDSAQLSLLDQLSRIVSLEVIQGQKTSLPIGTWVSYQHLPSLLRRRSEIKKILFLDASLSALAASMLFRFPFDNYGIVAIQLTAPEVHLRGNFLKAGVKRKLYQLATQYRQLKVALRTPELTASWRKSGLIAPDACLELPTLELTNVTLPPQKSSISQRESLVFVVAGQLRPQKNIGRIGPLFRNALVPGKLVVAGPMPGNLTASNHLAAIVTGSGDRICFIPEFLKESDLHKIVGEAHYNLMLYVDWDDRMEAAMLFTSARMGTPIIGHQSGWLGRMITEYELGYAINAYNPDEIRACLVTCALPGSAEYARFEHGLRRLIADHQTEIVAPAFLSALDLSAPIANR